MGIKNIITKAGVKAADKVAKLSVLSPEQLQTVQNNREAYLTQVPEMDDEAAEELTSRLLAAGSVEIFNGYLDQIANMYVPVKRSVEYEKDFNPDYNIRYFEITKWVTDTKENSIEKLINVYEVLFNEECNIALVFHRTCQRTFVYLAVTNTNNANDNVDVENYRTRIIEAIKGNFPGSEVSAKNGKGIIPCLKSTTEYSVASASNIPGEKSEKFMSQTIEKLLDGTVPDSVDKEYTIILLATPIKDIENRKIHLAELYSGLAPYSGWETNFTYTQSDSVNATATFGVNVGASAGIQQGQTQANTVSRGETDSSSKTETDSSSKGETKTEGQTETATEGTTETNSTSSSEGKTEGTSSTDNILKKTWHGLKGGEAGSNASDTLTKTTAESLAKNVAKSVAKSSSKAISETVSHSVANTLGKAVSNTVAKTSGMYKGINLGTNIGANFARASTVTATVGKNESIVQHFTNYNIKHVLQKLEAQMKRLEQSTAFGMWEFAAYVLSEDQNVANNVAYSYLALTQGESSNMSQTAVNLWRGDMGEDSGDAEEICGYLKELRHPIFALNPVLSEEVPISNVYPAVVTATTSLSGKELAYSLNFPRKSITGLPVFSCAEFGRDIISYDQDVSEQKISIGKVFHMNHVEPVDVKLALPSLSSHTFITGSTGAGKSNTVYKIIEETSEKDIPFMIIEPSKGEYKSIFGGMPDVSVYGTNPGLSPLLRINPFSFPNGIHICEHMDRLVEIFNVCWPMYAAMPAVLKSAIEKSYVDCGWNLIDSKNKYGKPYYPVFKDVARNIREIIDSSEYDTENKGAYKGSLLTRLQSLSNGINGMVFTSNEISPEELFNSKTIIDLSRVGSSETKSLLMGMIVLKLQEYRIATAKTSNSPLTHITVLEEAHNLLKRTSTEQPVEGGNLLGKSVEMLSNAIAEMRTYGEGFIIVDQSPGLLDMSVIRNTNTKIIMRLPDQGDRELVGHAANLNDDQIKELAKLPRGVGAIYQNEWIQPILCKVDRFNSGNETYHFEPISSCTKEPPVEDRLFIAELLSKGVSLGNELSKDEVMERIECIGLSDYETISIINLLKNPPKEPNMKQLAPVMAMLFPEIKESVRQSYIKEDDVTELTREADEMLIKYAVDDQVRRDIIQSVITYYMIYETNNRPLLEDWIRYGGLK